MAVGVTLFGAELSAALFSRSLALLADSGHVALDVFALGLAYGAHRLVRRRPDKKYTYGYHRAEVLAAALNALLLLLLVGFVVREALVRLWSPAPVLWGPMVVMAGVGLGGNVLMAFLLGSHEARDLNMRAAFLHVVGDALGSVAVLVAALGLALFRAPWMDTVASLLISGLLLVGAARVLRRAGRVLAEGVPEGLSLAEITGAMLAYPGVREVHDLHVWSLGPRFSALTAHVVVGERSLPEAEAVVRHLGELIRERFGIGHVTLQVEGEACGGPWCNGREEGPGCGR